MISKHQLFEEYFKEVNREKYALNHMIRYREYKTYKNYRFNKVDDYYDLVKYEIDSSCKGLYDEIYTADGYYTIYVDDLIIRNVFKSQLNSFNKDLLLKYNPSRLDKDFDEKKPFFEILLYVHSYFYSFDTQIEENGKALGNSMKYINKFRLTDKNIFEKAEVFFEEIKKQWMEKNNIIPHKVNFLTKGE